MIDSSFLAKFYDKFPMVKVLNLGEKLYAYDAKSYFLTEISAHQMYLLYRAQNKRNNQRLPDFMIWLLKNNVFKSGEVKKLTPSLLETKELVKDELENQIPRRCTLEITEKCTLRCKYCFYTNDDLNKRKHSYKSMQKKVAFKAIDLYFLRYTSAINKIPKHRRREVYKMLPPVLTWWGGEPLIVFDLLKETKKYIESLNWESYGIKKSNIYYSIVTNFTILNDEIIDFLVENKINLQISLDGDQEEHDKNRVFSNGEGSFQQVFKNINILIDRFPEYVRNHVTINTVFADNTNLNKITVFIKENFDIDKLNRKVLLWRPSFERHEGEFVPKASFNHDFQSDTVEFRNSLTKLASKKTDDLNKILLDNKSLYSQLLELFFLEQQIEFDNPKGRDDLSRTFSCPLGSDVLFVSRNGDFHCCCKVDHSFPLGNVNLGLIAEKIESVYSTYFEQINTQCKKCWAVNFCKICPALVCWNGEFKLPSTIECDNIRGLVEANLAKYIILSTEFESLYDIIMSFFENVSKDYRFDSIPTNIKFFQV